MDLINGNKDQKYNKGRFTEGVAAEGVIIKKCQKIIQSFYPPSPYFDGQCRTREIRLWLRGKETICRNSPQPNIHILQRANDQCFNALLFAEDFKTFERC